MRFGVRLIQHLGSSRDIIELGILVDKAGFDQAWFPSDKFDDYALYRVLKTRHGECQ